MVKARSSTTTLWKPTPVQRTFMQYCRECLIVRDDITSIPLKIRNENGWRGTFECGEMFDLQSHWTKKFEKSGTADIHDILLIQNFNQQCTPKSA